MTDSSLEIKLGEILRISDLIEVIKSSYTISTQGLWQKGISTHHTVTQTGYRIGEFHHANDAEFCDIMHFNAPRIAEVLEKQKKAIDTFIEAILHDRFDWEDWPENSRKAFLALKDTSHALNNPTNQRPSQTS